MNTDGSPLPGIRGAIPYVYCADAGATAQWLVATLGFVERGRWHDDDGAVTNVELVVEGAGEVWLDGPKPDWTELRGGLSAWTGFLVDDVDAIYVLVCERGAECDAPRDRFFGVRELTVTDPEGHQWGFMERH